MKITLSFLATVFFIWLALFDSQVVLGDGVKAPNTPIQVNLKKHEKDAIPFDQYTIYPQASFELTAKILSKKDYSRGREVDLSKTDLALGWGTMSDEAVLETISISQSRRWYRWKTPHFKIPRRDIERQSANMHMIPANDSVQDVIDDAKQGELIHLKGYLVRVTAEDGWRWQSSLTRDDTGAGACEVIYVENASLAS